MITLNDYLYSGDTLLRILKKIYPGSADRSKKKKNATRSIWYTVIS